MVDKLKPGMLFAFEKQNGFFELVRCVGQDRYDEIDKWNIKVHKILVINTRSYKGKHTTMLANDIIKCNFIGYDLKVVEVLFGG